MLWPIGLNVEVKTAFLLKDFQGKAMSYGGL